MSRARTGLKAGKSSCGLYLNRQDHPNRVRRWRRPPRARGNRKCDLNGTSHRTQNSNTQEGYKPDPRARHLTRYWKSRTTEAGEIQRCCNIVVKIVRPLLTVCGGDVRVIRNVSHQNLKRHHHRQTVQEERYREVSVDACPPRANEP